MKQKLTSGERHARELRQLTNKISPAKRKALLDRAYKRIKAAENQAFKAKVGRNCRG